jgi:hypothetical protein
LNGYQFGLISCGKPLGQGVQYNSFAVMLTSPTSATTSGSVVQYYAAGTLHGTFHLNSTIMSANDIIDHGTSTIVGGTGAYKGATGEAQISCVTTDGAVHHNCSIKLRLHLP